MDLKKAIEKRVDVKRYDLKKPDWRKIIRAIDMARFGTSAGEHFAVRFILVSDEKTIRKLADSSQQSFIAKAKYLVCVFSDPTSLIRSYGDRGKKYCELQAGAAIENFLLGLEEQKLVTSWVWYYEDSQVKELLGIGEGASVQGLFPIGKVGRFDKPKKRNVELNDILFFEKNKNKKMVPSVVVSDKAR